ncbi:MAG: hypothetical protein CML18_14800 [Pusillimonas sp.]|jgi:hypothetical protein|nr:hypothetical protein [Pusillimonas sp.]|tara:strand:+ start:612 stop:821 length:210 start_codon:yes stop_codon:yes gene_type:complete
MARNWTPQQRKERAQDARRRKLWEYSTGPKTAEGLSKTRFNSTTTGVGTQQAVALRRAVAALLDEMGKP